MITIGPRLAAVALLMTAAAAASAAEHRDTRHAPAAKEATPATTRTLGKSGAWAAYLSQDSTGKVCYLVGEPEKSEPSGVARKTPMAMVTHRPAENIANVVSFVEGYPLKDGSEVALDIGGEKFELFTNGDSAWARTAELDKTIVTTLAKARRAVVKGTPQKGSPTTDVYMLSGFAEVLAMIDKACGVEREKPHPAAAAHHRKPKPKSKAKAKEPR